MQRCEWSYDYYDYYSLFVRFVLLIFQHTVSKCCLRVNVSNMSASHSFWNNCNILGILVAVTGLGFTVLLTIISWGVSGCNEMYDLFTFHCNKIFHCEGLACGWFLSIGFNIFLYQPLLVYVPGFWDHRFLWSCTRNWGSVRDDHLNRTYLHRAWLTGWRIEEYSGLFWWCRSTTTPAQPPAQQSATPPCAARASPPARPSNCHCHCPSNSACPSSPGGRYFAGTTL